MFLHLGCDWVALVIMRYRLSPRHSSPFQHSACFQVPPHSGRNIPISPDRFSFSNPRWRCTPSLLTDCVQHCSLLSLQASSRWASRSLLSHRNFSPITFVYTPDGCAYM